jgi:HEAT repeat protein
VSKPMPPAPNPVREPLNRALRELSTATKVVSFYPPEHPAVRVAVDRFLSTITGLLATQAEIELGFAEAGVLHGGEFLPDNDRTLQTFAAFLLNRGVARLTLRRGLEAETFTSFLRFLSSEPARISQEGGLARFLESRGIHTLQVAEIDLEKLLASESEGVDPEVPEGDKGAWKRIIGDFLRSPGDRATEGIKSLIQTLANDGAKLQELMQELGAESSRDLPRLMGRLAEEVKKEFPETVEPFLSRLGESLLQLPSRLRMDLVLHKIPLSDGTSDLMQEVCGKMTDPMIVEMVASFLETEGQLSPRLFAVCTKVFAARGRTAPYFGPVTAFLQRQAGSAELGRIWQSLQGLLVESDQDYLSDTYRATLDTISRQPGELDAAVLNALAAAPGYADAFTPEGIASHACRVVLHALDSGLDESQTDSLRDDIDRRVRRMSGRACLPLLSEAVRVLSEPRESDLMAPTRAALDHRLKSAAEQMVKIFRDEFERLSEEERAREIRSFKELGGLAAQALLDGLAVEENWEIRKGLLSALTAVGRPAVPLLLKRLGDPSWYLVRNVALLLGQIGGQSLVEPLAGLLQHDEPRVRREAAGSLGKIGGPRAVGHLRRAVLDSEVGTVAARVLGEIDRENTVAMFTKRLSRTGLLIFDDAPVREAIAVLGEMEAAEAVPLLSRILNQGLWIPIAKGDGVRTQAAQALQRIGTSDALEAIRRASRSSRRVVRDTCEALSPSRVSRAGDDPAAAPEPRP